MGVESSDRNRLYIRLPVKIREALQIKLLHKNIVRVHIPRQKSRRWCIVEFANKEQLEEAKQALTDVQIDNKPIKIGTYKGRDLKTTKTKKVTTNCN